MRYIIQIMDLTPKQQTSEAIRQAETILIMTGQHPSVDQVTATLGLAAILRKFGKKASVVMSDSLPASVQILDTAGVERNLGGLRDFVLKVDVTRAEVDKLRYEVADGKLNIYISPFKGSFAPSDVTFDYGKPSFEYDLAIVLGVPTRARIDRAYEQNMALFENIPMVNLDFHRSNENYGAVNLIEPNASSLCEMSVATSESLQSGLIDAEIATTFLMGTMASTDRFTAAHTTSKSLTVAAQMMAAGGRQPAVVRALYRDGRGGGDSKGERSGGSEQSRSGGDQPRNAERSQGGQRPAAPRNEQRSEPRSDQRQPRQPERQPERQTEHRVEAPKDDLPIIQPGHIEMSEPVTEVQAPEALSSETRSPEVAPAPVPFETNEPMPAHPPMADFAAAAEVLAQRGPDETSAPVQPNA